MENKRKEVVTVEAPPEYEMKTPVGPDQDILTEHVGFPAHDVSNLPIADDEPGSVAIGTGLATLPGVTPRYPVESVVAPNEIIVHPLMIPSLPVDAQAAQDEEIVFPEMPLPAMPGGVDVKDNPQQRKQFFFDGQWIADEDPLKIGEGNFSDIKNLRYRDRGLEGVDGYGKINTTLMGSTFATYYLGRSGIQLKTEYAVGSYVLVQVWDGTGTYHAIAVNETAIPSAGNFSATLLHTDASGAGLGRFSQWPEGNVAYCNGVEAMIWAGDEMPVAAMITSTAAIANSVTNAVDYTNAVRNTLTTPGNVAILGGGNDTYTKLLLHCDGISTPAVISDSSVGGAGGTGHGNATVVGSAYLYSGVKKYGDACLYGAGTTNYIYFADHADWNFGSGDFTIDLWVHPTDTGSRVIVKQRAAANDVWWLGLYGASNNVIFYCTSPSGLLVSLTGNISLSTHTWYHIAVVRNGTTFSIYVNGVLDISNTFNITMPDLAQPLDIMGPTEDGIDAFVGCIDELHISNGIARWTGNSFTVPAAAYRDSALYFLVGSTRPLQGVKIYLSSVNAIAAATLTVQEWNGAAWASLTVTDNTSGLGASGTVTWASTVGTSKLKFLEGRLLYWYQFALSAGSAEAYHVTVDAPFQAVKDIWDGIYRVIGSFRYNVDTANYDKTLDVAAHTPSGVAAADSYTANLGTMDSDDIIYVGCEERLCGIRIWMFEGETGQVNDQAATLSVYYWDGNDWAAVTGKVDGTLDSGGTKTLAQSGTLSWTPTDPGEEFQRNMNNLQLYYYKIMASATLGTTVRIDVIGGIPAPKSIDADMTFPLQFQGRAMLCKKNRVAYSSAYAPDVWNGEDSSNGSSGEIYVGGDNALTGAIQIYNRFGSSIYNTAILTKATETYLLDGSGPDDWRLYTISTNIGCPAPLTMATAEVGYDMSQEAVRNIAIWLSHAGPVLFDGGTIVFIKKGVSCYFDPTDSRCIEMDSIENAVGWVDTIHHEYNLCIPSGVGEYFNNVWLVYDLIRKKWFKKYPGAWAYHPQAVVAVQDVYGNQYVYVCDANGWMLRTEYGNTWNGTDIAQLVTTADLVPSGDIWDHSRLRRVKLICDAISEDEDVTIKHYVNGSSSATTLSLVGADGSDRYVRNTQAVNLKGWSHKFEFSASTGATSKGVPLLAWGFTYEVIREDH